MGYYAKINNNIVEKVIVASPSVIALEDGVWVETFLNHATKKYAGVGDAWNGSDFIPYLFEGSTWDGVSWSPSVEMQLEAALLMIDILMEV